MMMTSAPRALAVGLIALVCTACNGGSPQTAPFTPAPTPTPVASVTASVAFSSVGSTTTLPTLGRATTSTLTIPPATGTGTLAVTATRTFPTDLPALQLVARQAASLKPLATSSYTAYFAIEFVPSAATTLSGVPSFTVAFDDGDVPSGTSLYVAYLTGNNGSPTWTTVAGPTVYSGGVFRFTGATAAQPLNAGQRYGLVVYANASGSPVGMPTASPSPGASSGPTSSPSPAPTANTNPATIGAYVLGADANGNSAMRVILPGASDYGRIITLPAGWSFNALDTDAAGNAYISGFSTVSGGHTGSDIERIATGTTGSAASIPVASTYASTIAAAPNGTLYITSPTTISYIAPNSTTIVNPIPYNSTQVTALRTDTSGNVYSIQKTGTTFALVEYAPLLASVLRTVPLSTPTTFSFAGPIGIDSAGTTYVAISSGSSATPNAIAVIAPNATTAANTTLATGAAADFAFDSSNNVYVAIGGTNNSTNGFSVYTASLGALTRSVIKPESDGGSPFAIRADPQGAVYLSTGAGYSSGFLYIYAPGASTPSVRTATGLSLPIHLSLGS